MSRGHLADGTPYHRCTVMVLGQDQVDDFDALCHILGRRPHQLAADLVLAGIRRHRQDPGVAAQLDLLRDSRAEHDAEARVDRKPGRALGVVR